MTASKLLWAGAGDTGRAGAAADFGVDARSVFEALPAWGRLRERCEARAA